MTWKGYFRGKKITVLGLGLLGRGIGDIEFLAKQGASLIVTDQKSEKELKLSLAKLRRFKNIRYVLGKHQLEDFRDRDLILKAAGVPLDSLYVAEAKKQGIPVDISTALFALLTKAMVVGITGTRGKSTVTHLIYHTLKGALRRGSGHPKGRVFLGGNVKGVSTLALLPKTKKG